MPEVCSLHCVGHQHRDRDRVRKQIRCSKFIVTLAKDPSYQPQVPPYRYQNTIRNTYAVVTRPPQTRAAHFKRLYRK
jgi:hypothetical protein